MACRRRLLTRDSPVNKILVKMLRDNSFLVAGSFRDCPFGIEFRSTSTMTEQTGTQAPAQAGIEDFNGIFQERLRGIVREGLLSMFE